MKQEERDLNTWRTYIESFIRDSFTFVAKDALVADVGVGESTNILRGHYSNFKVIDRRTDTYVDYLYDIENPIDINTKFDAIYLMEVLEHTNYPWKVAENLEKILKDDGVIVVSVPSFLYWHPMQPVCGDNWRFLPGHIEYLFPNFMCIFERTCNKDHLRPLGMCYILRKK